MSSPDRLSVPTSTPRRSSGGGGSPHLWLGDLCEAVAVIAQGDANDQAIDWSRIRRAAPSWSHTRGGPPATTTLSQLLLGLVQQPLDTCVALLLEAIATDLHQASSATASIFARTAHRGTWILLSALFDSAAASSTPSTGSDNATPRVLPLSALTPALKEWWGIESRHIPVLLSSLTTDRGVTKESLYLWWSTLGCFDYRARCALRAATPCGIFLFLYHFQSRLRDASHDVNGMTHIGLRSFLNVFSRLPPALAAFQGQAQTAFKRRLSASGQDELSWPDVITLLSQDMPDTFRKLMQYTSSQHGSSTTDLLQHFNNDEVAYCRHLLQAAAATHDRVRPHLAAGTSELSFDSFVRDLLSHGSIGTSSLSPLRILRVIHKLRYIPVYFLEQADWRMTLREFTASFLRVIQQQMDEYDEEEEEEPTTMPTPNAAAGTPNTNTTNTITATTTNQIDHPRGSDQPNSAKETTVQLASSSDADGASAGPKESQTSPTPSDPVAPTASSPTTSTTTAPITPSSSSSLYNVSSPQAHPDLAALQRATEELKLAVARDQALAQADAAAASAAAVEAAAADAAAAAARAAATTAVPVNHSSTSSTHAASAASARSPTRHTRQQSSVSDLRRFFESGPASSSAGGSSASLDASTAALVGHARAESLSAFQAREAEKAAAAAATAAAHAQLHQRGRSATSAAEAMARGHFGAREAEPAHTAISVDADLDADSDAAFPETPQDALIRRATSLGIDTPAAAAVLVEAAAALAASSPHHSSYHTRNSPPPQMPLAATTIPLAEAMATLPPPASAAEARARKRSSLPPSSPRYPAAAAGVAAQSVPPIDALEQAGGFRTQREDDASSEEEDVATPRRTAAISRTHQEHPSSGSRSGATTPEQVNGGHKKAGSHTGSSTARPATTTSSGNSAGKTRPLRSSRSASQSSLRPQSAASSAIGSRLYAAGTTRRENSVLGPGAYDVPLSTFGHGRAATMAGPPRPLGTTHSRSVSAIASTSRTAAASKSEVPGPGAYGYAAPSCFASLPSLPGRKNYTRGVPQPPRAATMLAEGVLRPQHSTPGHGFQSRLEDKALARRHKEMPGPGTHTLPSTLSPTPAALVVSRLPELPPSSVASPPPGTYTLPDMASLAAQSPRGPKWRGGIEDEVQGRSPRARSKTPTRSNANSRKK